MGRQRAEFLTDLRDEMRALPRDSRVTLYADEIAMLVDRLLDLEEQVTNHATYGAHSAAS